MMIDATLLILLAVVVAAVVGFCLAKFIEMVE